MELVSFNVCLKPWIKTFIIIIIIIIIIIPNTTDIGVTLIRNRLRWLGHVAPMLYERPVKAHLYGELV